MHAELPKLGVNYATSTLTACVCDTRAIASIDTTKSSICDARVQHLSLSVQLHENGQPSGCFLRNAPLSMLFQRQAVAPPRTTNKTLSELRPEMPPKQMQAAARFTPMSPLSVLSTVPLPGEVWVSALHVFRSRICTQSSVTRGLELTRGYRATRVKSKAIEPGSTSSEIRQEMQKYFTKNRTDAYRIALLQPIKATLDRECRLPARPLLNMFVQTCLPAEFDRIARAREVLFIEFNYNWACAYLSL